jgi:hypothetical protein
MTLLNGYEVYPDQTTAARLGAAVWLIDDFTGKPPIGNVEVLLEGVKLKSLKNPSGYFLFLNLPGGEYQVWVKSDYYFDEKETVVLATPDSRNPLVEIKLKPKPSYPFFSGTTLIRGRVLDTDENPLPGALVKVRGKGITNKTTKKGELVLYFKGLKDEDLIDDKFIKGDSGATIFLEATHESANVIIEVDEVEVGKTTILEAPIIISRE